MQAAEAEVIDVTAEGETASEEECGTKHARDSDKADDCASSMAGLSVEDEQFLAELTESMGEQDAQTLTKRKKRRLLQLAPNQRQALTLRAKITQCARTNDIATAVAHYNAAKEANSSIDKDTFVILVALTSGFAAHTHSQHAASQAETQTRGDLPTAMTILSDAQLAGVELPEASYSSVIRCCGMHGEVDTGLQLLQELKSKGLTPKHRSYSPLIAAASTTGDVVHGFELWDEMLSLELVPLEKDYVAVLRLCVISHDAERFYAIVEQFMDEIDVPSQESWPVLRQWFLQSPFPDGTGLHKMPLVDVPARDAVIEEAEFSGDSVTCVCVSRITDEGVCLANGDTLASIELTPEDRDQLLQKIETFVLERGRYQKDGVWQKFKDWCAEAKAEQRYDLIIDGANVGYHKQNYAGAPSHVAYNQIDAMARLLKAKGFKPVIVLHRRHLSSKTLPEAYRPTVKRWEDEGMLYITPHGNNDDWFWLFAAVSWGVHVVTNDEMRDHDFNMLAPKWFSRWRERHACKYLFGKKTLVYTVADGAQAGETKAQESKARELKEENGVIDLSGDSDDDNATVTAANKSGLPDHKFVQSKHIRVLFPPVYSQRSQRTARGWYFPAQGTDRWLCVCHSSDLRKAPDTA